MSHGLNIRCLRRLPGEPVVVGCVLDVTCNVKAVRLVAVSGLPPWSGCIGDGGVDGYSVASVYNGYSNVGS